MYKYVYDNSNVSTLDKMQYFCDQCAVIYWAIHDPSKWHYTNLPSIKNIVPEANVNGRKKKQLKKHFCQGCNVQIFHKADISSKS